MVCAKDTLSAAGRRRFIQTEREPLFLCDWVSALFIHFEVDPLILQRETPYELDLREGKAYVSLVAFTMERLRPRRGGRLSAAAFAPIARHSFLNVRTYVLNDGEPGIYFILEWLSSRLAVLLGPPSFGLPYHHGHLDYRHDADAGTLSGKVRRGRSHLSYHGQLPLTLPSPSRGEENNGNEQLAPRCNFSPCVEGSLDEWLMERYVAFTRRGATPMHFCVWHPPWPQARVSVTLDEDKLLRIACPWYKHAELIGGNFSTGVRDVWIGCPRTATAFFNDSSLRVFSGGECEPFRDGWGN